MQPKIRFSTYSTDDFLKKSLEIFRFQAKNNTVYREYIERIGCDSNSVKKIEQIPFLPITFFKTHKITTKDQNPEVTFLSSGTTGMERSKHLVTDVNLYEKAFMEGFRYFFGRVQDYTILALLPSYLEQKNSSLVYMVNHLIKQTNRKDSGFYLKDYDELIHKLIRLDSRGEKILLLGVTYALLDLLELKKFQLKNTLIMETGGMKGRRKEMIKSELHENLQKGFGVNTIYSEYGMTELLSQAYSTGNALYETPPWMKIMIREVEDPFTILPKGKSGGINIIDFANINSCSFIATQDLGKRHSDEKFEILGRFDNSDIRGCNLML